MSVLNDDKKPIQEGRREPLTEVDAPLRDQVVKKLFNKLEDLEIGHKVEELWTKGTSNRAEALNRQRAFLASWDDHGTGDTSGPFSGSSNLHIPIPLIVVKTFHARAFQALMGVDPPFHTKARNEASIERVPTVADTMRYYIQDGANYGRGIEDVVDRWVWDWCATGTGIKKWRWDVKYTRFIDVQEVPAPGPTQYTIVDGKQVAIPTTVMKEEEVPVTHKCFDGPVCELLDLEDVITVGDPDPDLADSVLHRQFVTASELWTYADRKVFNADAVKEVIEGGPNRMDGALGAEIKAQRALNAGRNSLHTESELDRYEIVEAYLKVDVDGSGINSDVIVWVHLKSKRLLRATYLHRVSPSGERPFVKAIFQPRKGQEFGVGLVEMMYPLAQELDAIHNMRLDWGMISVMPFGFYRPSSGIDPATIQLEPGALIPVENPQTDVFFPNLGNRTVFGFQEEQAVHTMIERLTNISDLNLGVISGQGATRTASGARIMNNEMSANLDVYLKRLNRGWKKSLRYHLHLLQKRIPAGTSFRLTGEDGKDYWRTIKSAKDLEGDFDIEVLPNSASSNEGIMQEKAFQVMQAVADPLAIQLGIVTPAQFYEAKKNMLQALGIKDWGRFIQKPTAVTRMLTPEEEANRVLRGISVPVTMEMDHEGFIGFFDMIVKNDDLLGQFNEEQTVLLAKQAKEHERMLMALKQMEAQKANAQQMRQNAAMSSQQAPAAQPIGGQAVPGAQ